MTTQQFITDCKAEIKRYYFENLNREIHMSDIYTVWCCKTLQNNKALLSTDIPDHRYFECTYNGDKKELYFDSYVKEFNRAVPIEE